MAFCFMLQTPDSYMATEKGREANWKKVCDNKKHSGRQTNHVEDHLEGNSCGKEYPAFAFVVTEDN